MITQSVFQIIGKKNNSQSFGAVRKFEAQEFPETDDCYRSLEFRFLWDYNNTCDNKRGQAMVRISNVYTKDKIKFIAEINILETKEQLVLEGYLEQ